MSSRRHLALCASLALSSVAVQAQTKPVDRCRAYADSQVALAQRANPKACPEFKGRAASWDSHFDWCTRQSPARVQREQEEYDARFDGCMSGIEAAKTEKALADADRRAKASASTGSYAQRWEKGVRRMADLGMTKPFMPKGYEFAVTSTESKRWGAGMTKGGQVGFYAVCDTCKGIVVRVTDGNGKLLLKESTPGNAIELIAYPQHTGNGAIEFTVDNCQTRDDRCRVRYTSFTLPN